MFRFFPLMEGAGNDGGAGGGAAGGEGGAGGNAGGTGAAPWYGTVDAETKSYIDNKGFKAPGDLITSYRNLEKLRGVPAERLVTLPEKPDDAAGWNSVYDKLGRPKSADEYKIEFKNIKSEDVGKGLRTKAHELGLNPTQTAKIGEFMDSLVGNLSATQQTRAADAAVQQREALKNNWGSGYDKNMQVSIGTAKMLGLDEATIDKLEGALGYDGLFMFLRDLGQKFGEDQFVAGDGKGPGVITRESASQELEALKKDKVFMAKYANPTAEGHAEAVQRMQKLMKIKHGEAA